MHGVTGGWGWGDVYHACCHNYEEAGGTHACGDLWVCFQGVGPHRDITVKPVAGDISRSAPGTQNQNSILGDHPQLVHLYGLCTSRDAAASQTDYDSMLLREHAVSYRRLDRLNNLTS